MKSNRYSKYEATPLFNCTFHFDTTSMSFYNVTSNCQAQTTTSSAWSSNKIGFRASLIHFIETLKDARQILCRNTDPCITNKEGLHFCTFLQVRSDYYNAAGGSKFNGVVNKINQYA